MQAREDLPDDVPVADAVEQQRPASDTDLDEGAPGEPAQEPPLEAAPADWQDQLETVEMDPDEGMTRD